MKSGSLSRNILHSFLLTFPVAFRIVKPWSQVHVRKSSVLMGSLRATAWSPFHFPYKSPLQPKTVKGFSFSYGKLCQTAVYVSKNQCWLWLPCHPVTWPREWLHDRPFIPWLSKRVEGVDECKKSSRWKRHPSRTVARLRVTEYHSMLAGFARSLKAFKGWKENKGP